MCQMSTCYYTFNLDAHKKAIWGDGTCANYKNFSLVKNQNELSSKNKIKNKKQKTTTLSSKPPAPQALFFVSLF